jgi:4-amino-4-deoxy-L-arabinose transferase-like glycosyltransferase
MSEGAVEEADIGTKRAAPVSGLAPRAADELRRDVLAASGIFFLTLMLYLLPAFLSRPLLEEPEARVAVVAREMLRSGNYIVPTLAGEARANKPPLPYWLVAGAATVLGGGDGTSVPVMTRATLLPPALFSALCVFLIVLYGCLVFGRPAGVMAGLILGLSLFVCRYAQLGFGDATLMCLCACMACSAAWLLSAPRPGLLCALALGGSLGLAVLTKGHVPLCLLLGPLVIEVLIRRSFSGRKVLIFLAAMIVAGAIAAPWFMALNKQAPGSWDVMVREVLDGVNPGAHQQSDRWHFYGYKLLGALLPWTALVLAAWALFAARKRNGQGEDASGAGVLAREHLRFFVLFSVLGFLGFYAMPKQQEHYLLPLLPALAMASGCMLSRFRFAGGINEERLAWAQLSTGYAVGLCIATLPAWPMEWFAETPRSEEMVSWLFQPLGWAITVPTGLAVYALHFYCARQCVEGKPQSAVFATALVAYAALASGTGFWAVHERDADTLTHEAARVQARLQELGTDARVYATGLPEARLCFLLDQKIKTERDLAAEAAAPEAAGVRRALVVERRDLEQLSKDYDYPFAEEAQASNGAVLVLLLPDGKRDWPKEAARVTEQRKAARRQAKAQHAVPH